MPHLRNPGGRIVAVDNMEMYMQLLSQPGFEKITEKEERDFVQARYSLKTAMTRKDGEPDKLAVYMATVSQGGKDGYGIASKYLIEELRNLDVTVNTFQAKQKIGLLFHNPYSITRMDNPIKLIYTMFESTKIPEDWPDYLREADEVLVPSKWCKGVFAKSGIQTRVVPLGYNDDVFTYKKRHNKRKAKEPFTFIHYNAFNARKGFLEVFKAFTKAFDPAEPVRMIFKTTLEYIPSAFPINPRQYPNIEVITGSCSDKDLAALLHRSDCFVFPSRGEGFGMTPLEAMGTGLPVIVPNAHGITEYFDREYMYEVNVKEECPAIYSKYKGEDVGKMVVCDVDHLAAQMRYIYEHQDEAIKKGELASKYVKRYTWKRTAKKLAEILQEYYIKEPQPKVLQNVLSLEAVR